MKCKQREKWRSFHRCAMPRLSAALEFDDILVGYLGQFSFVAKLLHQGFYRATNGCA